ncbi:MAG: MFS transporter [Anaerofustis sp.]
MESSRISKKLNFLYGLPDFGFALFVYVELYYFSAFLTDYAKLSLDTVAIILAATSAIDMIWVPVTGIIIEKCNFKWGKFRSWFVLASPFVIVFFTLMFTKIGSEGLAAMIITVSFGIKTLAQNLVYSGHLSQMSIISNSPQERTSLSARKVQYNTLGILVFSAVGLPVITMFGKMTNTTTGYTLGACFFAVIYFLTCVALFALTKGVEPTADAKAESGSSKPKMSIGSMLKALFTNPPLLVILIADSFRQVGRFLIIASAFYYLKVVLNSVALMTTYLLCVNLAGFAGSFLTTPLTKAVGKKGAYMIFLSFCCAGLLVAYFFGSTPVIFIAALTVTMGMISPINAIVSAMLADTVVYDEYKNHTPARGFIMSMVNLPIKLGAFFRSLILPAALAAAGYAAGKAADAHMIAGVKNLITMYPFLFIALAIVIVLIGYRLSEKKVVEMTEEIEKRA